MISPPRDIDMTSVIESDYGKISNIENMAKTQSVVQIESASLEEFKG
jgi:hypothetical protein